jgi:protein TonB
METTLRTFIGSVACVDLVGYSKLPVDRQIEVKKRFNARLMKALSAVSTKDRVLLDTGDGVLIGFLGDPEQSFTVSLKIREILEPGSVRMGIHLGSVKLLPGMSGEMRLVGDTANIAERITAFAEPGQIVVSRSFHAMVSRLSDRHEALFRNEGVRTDKQGQEHEIYVVDAPVVKKAAVSPAAIYAAVGVAALAVAGAGTWFLMRRSPSPAATATTPDVASKGETTRMAEARPPSKETAPAPPPLQQPAAKPEPAPVTEAKKPRPAPSRSEHPAGAPPPATTTAAGGSSFTAESQRLLSALTGGASSVAKSVGSAAQGAYATVKEKTFSAASSGGSGAGTPRSGPPVPTLVSRASVYFPPEAAAQGITNGKVRARLDIDAEGVVTHVTVLSAEPPGVFDREAVRSLKLWRFNIGPDGRTYEAEVGFRR